VDDLNSLNIILHWIDDVDRYAPYAAKFLVGNKSDLDRDDWEIEEGKAKMFMENNSLVTRFTVSAKTGEGVKEMFQSISLYLMQKKVVPTLPHSDPFQLTEEDQSLDLRQQQSDQCPC
jgi:GTPase SAR1 family protein